MSRGTAFPAILDVRLSKIKISLRTQAIWTLKHFRESLGIRDNESRLYFYYWRSNNEDRNTTWAEAQHFLQDWMCAYRRLRSACASKQSDHTVFAVRLKTYWILGYPQSGMYRLWSVSCEDSDQTACTCSLIWTFAGRTCNIVGNAVPRLRMTEIQNYSPKRMSFLYGIPVLRSRFVFANDC